MNRLFFLVPVIGPGCPWDLNGDGTVNVLDMLLMYGYWGPCESTSICPPDFTGDGTVNVLDLLDMFAHWGPACDGEGAPELNLEQSAESLIESLTGGGGGEQ